MVDIFQYYRLHSAHPNRATQICTSRPVLTLRISKLFTPARWEKRKDFNVSQRLFRWFVSVLLISVPNSLLYIKWFSFFWHTRSPHLPTYLFPPFVVVSDQAYTDVIFITGSVGFSAHRFYIAAAAPSLARLIATATANSDINCSDIGTRSSSDCSMVRCIDSYWLNGPVILFISYVCDMCDGNQVSSVGDTSASGGSSYHSEETDTTCLLDVDRTHYLRLSNRIKEKLKRRCSFQVRSNSAANELN